MEIIRLETTDSTNNWVNSHESEIPSPALVYTITQTAGRGQRGNSWESEPGKNITASLIFHPLDFPASRQFQISESIALSLIDYLKQKRVTAKIKWPNDIYVGDKKIAGILVENVVTGKDITRTIAGFGLNLNQKIFESPAPNPVSLFNITGTEYDLETEIAEVASFISRRISSLTSPSLHDEFKNRLWRYDRNLHKFHDKIRDEIIFASIKDVGNDGILTLVTNIGEPRSFAFKEIEFIL